MTHLIPAPCVELAIHVSSKTVACSAPSCYESYSDVLHSRPQLLRLILRTVNLPNLFKARHMLSGKALLSFTIATMTASSILLLHACHHDALERYLRRALLIPVGRRMNAIIQTLLSGMCPRTTRAFNCRGLTKFGYFSAREASAYGVAYIFVSPSLAMQR